MFATALNWVGSHWGWLIGAGLPVVAIVAGMLLAPVATVKLLSAFCGAVADLAREVVTWARNNWWRAGFVIAAVVSVLLGYGMAQAEQEHAAREVAFNAALIAIQQERDRVTADRDKAVADLAQHDMDAAAEYARVTADLLAQREQNADLAQDLKEQAARAAKSDSAWWRVYEGRSDSCKAAQEALGVACKGVGKL